MAVLSVITYTCREGRLYCYANRDVDPSLAQWNLHMFVARNVNFVSADRSVLVLGTLYVFLDVVSSQIGYTLDIKSWVMFCSCFHFRLVRR